MTGTSKQIRAILLVTIMLLSGVAAGATLTGSVAAQESTDSTDAPQYNLEFNGGDIYAFGSPGPTDQTLTDVFDEDLEGFNGSIYAFDSADGSWTAVSGSDSVDVNALDAYVLTLDDGESASATINISQTEPAQTAQLGLSEGFNFITPTRAAGVDNNAFRVTQDAFTVQNPFAQPSVSPGDEGDFAAAEIGQQDTYRVNPFAGYFVSASGGLALSDVNTGMTQSEADDALGVTDIGPAEFVVQDLTPTDETVDEDQEFDVSANITNDGQLTDEQDIELRLEPDGDAVASQTVELVADESQTVTFENVSVDDPGEYNHTIASENSSVTGDLTVEEPEPASFTVTDFNPSEATVDVGEEFDVGAQIINDGDQSGEQDIELRLEPDGEPIANQTVQLDGAGSEIVAFENVSVDEAGEYNHTIASENDSESGNLTVEEVEPANFVVDALSPYETTVDVDEEFDISAEIYNTGDESGEQDIELRLEPDGDVVDNQTVAVAAGENETVTFENVSVDTAGEYNHTIASNDTTQSGNLTVVDPAFFEVSNLSPVDATVDEGEDFDVSADIENTGSEEATQDITLLLEPDATESTATEPAVTLAGGANETVVFENVSVDETGDYNHTVASGDDSATGNLSVVDTTVDIFEYTAENNDAQNITVTVWASEQLSDLTVSDDDGNSVSGVGTDGFNETVYDDGTHKYEATYDAGADGDYTVTLDSASDTNSNTDSNTGLSDSVSIDTTVETTSLTATNDNAQEITVTVEADEQLSDLSASDDSSNSVSGVGTDFTETDNGDGTYTYEATYNAGADGDYTVTLDSASDTNSNTDSNTGLSDSVIVT